MAHCLVCLAVKESHHEIQSAPSARVVLCVDSFGCRFYRLAMPLCEEHRAWPGIIEQLPGEKLT